MKTYELAPLEVSQRAKRIIGLYHGDVGNVDVSIDYIFATNERGHAVTHGGYPALAVCRIIPLKDRAAGRKDAEILIDQKAYEAMSNEQKDALLDHELHHLIVARNDDNSFKFDDLNRPRLKMRKHDYDFGWFTDIARRHGMNSPEVFQAKIIWDNDGQAFFPMLTEA